MPSPAPATIASTASDPAAPVGLRQALFGPLDNATRRRFGLPEEEGGRFRRR